MGEQIALRLPSPYQKRITRTKEQDTGNRRHFWGLQFDPWRLHKRKLPRPLSPCLSQRRPPSCVTTPKVGWGRVCSALYAAGLMTELDRAALAAYCAAYGRWAQAERAINRMAAKDGLNAALMIKTVSGNAIQNPLVGIANKAKADMVRYAAEFGMTHRRVPASQRHLMTRRKKTAPPAISDAATQYAQEVVAGKRVAGPHVRAQCARHLEGHSRGRQARAGVEC